MATGIDALDRKILRVLQHDATLGLDEIAAQVGSSKTPVWNRIRKMREAGVIGAQTVIVDAEKLGFEACFFVLIRTSEHEAEWQRAFLKALEAGLEGVPVRRVDAHINDPEFAEALVQRACGLIETAGRRSREP